VPRKKITATTIETLKAPASGQVDYFDAAYPALALRVTAKGVRSWVYFGRVHGKIKRATLGRYPDISLMRARQKAGETADAMRQGVDPAAAKREARNAVRDSFASVADDWLKRDQSKNRSHAEVRRVIDRDVKPAWDGRLITSITRRDIIELIDAIVDRGAVTYARRVHAHLHRLFRWCVGRGVVPINPMADLPKPGAAIKRDRVLSDTELALIWRAGGDAGWPFGLAILLLMLTGARRDEIRALRWSEINGDSIDLSGARTKNGEAHTIPLSPMAAQLVKQLPHIGKSDLVFTTTGKTPVSGWSKAKLHLDHAIANGNRGRELPPWRIHDLRRTVATGLQKLGVSLQVVEAVLGHVSGSRAGIVGVYQRHTFDAEKCAALDAWARHVDAIVSGKKANVTQVRRVAS
jgi:integrase